MILFLKLFFFALLAAYITYLIWNIINKFVIIKLGMFIENNALIFDNRKFVGYFLLIIQFIAAITGLFLLQIWFLDECLEIFKSFYTKANWFWKYFGVSILFLFFLPSQAISSLHLKHNSEYEYIYSKFYISVIGNLTQLLAIFYIICKYFFNQYSF